MYLSKQLQGRAVYLHETVSVPSRGCIDPNPRTELYLLVDNDSVPSRGCIYPNVVPADRWRYSSEQFPSPLGDVSIQTSRIPFKAQILNTSFRPLAGMYLFKHSHVLTPTILTGKRFRPLAGMYLFKQMGINTTVTAPRVSVPSRGCIYSNSEQHKRKESAMANVSVPSRGCIYSNPAPETPCIYAAPGTGLRRKPNQISL